MSIALLFRVRALFLCRSYHNVPVSNSSVIPLQIKRSWQFFVAVKSSTCYARNFLVVDNNLAILGNGDHSSNQGNVEALPLPGFASHFRGWGQKSIDC